MKNKTGLIFLSILFVFALQAFSGSVTDRVDYVYARADGIVEVKMQNSTTKLKLDPNDVGYHRFELLYSLLLKAVGTNKNIWIEWNDTTLNIISVSLYYN